MSLLAKYAAAVSVAESFGVKATEEGGKLSIKGTVEYQLQKDAIWDAIKKQAGWEGEVSADIRNEQVRHLRRVRGEGRGLPVEDRQVGLRRCREGTCRSSRPTPTS